MFKECYIAWNGGSCLCKLQALCMEPCNSLRLSVKFPSPLLLCYFAFYSLLCLWFLNYDIVIIIHYCHIFCFVTHFQWLCVDFISRELYSPWRKESYLTHLFYLNYSSLYLVCKVLSFQLALNQKTAAQHLVSSKAQKWIFITSPNVGSSQFKANKI